MKCTLLLVLGLAGFLTGAGQSTDTVTNARPHGNNAFTPDTIPWRRDEVSRDGSLIRNRKKRSGPNQCSSISLA
jgi:hypothetical protein